MAHPLLDLAHHPLPRAEEEELLRATHVLRDMGWGTDGIQRAVRAAKDLAGDSMGNQQPLIIYCDDQVAPHVAIRFPLAVVPAAAVRMNNELRLLLEARELDRPGLSISFWSTLPGARSGNNRQHERFR